MKMSSEPISVIIKKMRRSKLSGKALIVIDQNIIEKYEFKKGDIIELVNTSSEKCTATILYGSIEEDKGQNVVRIDSSLRRNLEVKENEIVTIRKADYFYANKVILAGLDEVIIIRRISKLTHLLNGRPITREDILSFNALGRRIDLVVVDFEPSSNVVIIKEDTEIILIEQTYEELTFDPKEKIPEIKKISRIYKEISIDNLALKINVTSKILLPILEDFIFNGTFKARIKRNYVIFYKDDKKREKLEKNKENEQFRSGSLDRKRKVHEISFIDSLFEFSNKKVEPNLISVMMPFREEFNGVYQMIKNTCESLDLTCNRADDIWKHDIIIQDVIDLIYCSSIVVVDLTGKNPNVFYEAGIAHTLRKDVILITQNDEDVPFNLRHLRYLKYENTIDGLEELKRKLIKRFNILVKKSID